MRLKYLLKYTEVSGRATVKTLDIFWHPTYVFLRMYNKFNRILLHLIVKQVILY